MYIQVNVNIRKVDCQQLPIKELYEIDNEIVEMKRKVSETNTKQTGVDGRKVMIFDFQNSIIFVWAIGISEGR